MGIIFFLYLMLGMELRQVLHPPALFTLKQESCYVVQAVLKLFTLLPQPPKYHQAQLGHIIIAKSRKQ